MRRWRVWAILALLACLPVLLNHSTSRTLLADTDTAFLLKVIRQRQEPMSWFVDDWPLQNHFYRPLPTLTFELDSRLYGDNPGGYAWTNAILCALCVLGLFWLLAEISRSPLWSFAGATIFSTWTIDQGNLLALPCYVAAGAVVLVGLFRHDLRIARYLPAALVFIFLGRELTVPQVSTSAQLGSYMLHWLPGRTASVMALFALLAAAAYVRYERARNCKLPPLPPSALDPPASTRTGIAPPPRWPWLWLTISVVAAAATFASYEQAVMLPAILLGLGVFLRFNRWKPDWKVHIIFWAMLGGYLALRHYLLPDGVSRYQAQQLRYGPSAYLDLAGYLLPSASQVPYLWAGVTESLWTLITPTGVSGVLGLTTMVTAAFQAVRNWPIVVTGWLLSTLAFLPMAYVKPFGHYHYWPMALRTIFVLGIAKVAWDLAVIAASRPVLQAPPRPSPAPGSLPRP